MRGTCPIAVCPTRPSVPHPADGIVLYQWKVLYNNAYSRSIGVPPTLTSPILNWATVPQTYFNNTLDESVRA